MCFLTSQRKHELVCEKWKQRQQKTPNSDDDRENFRFDDVPKQKGQDWRSQHDDLLKNVRAAREAAKMTKDRRYDSPSPPPADDDPGMWREVS